MFKPEEDALRYLAQSAVFRGVNIEDLRALQPPPEVITVRAGETLIRQDDLDTDYFVLISGRLRVYRNGLPIGQVLPGEGVGEMALLTNEPRSATVIARLDAKLVRFSQSTFLALVERHPSAVLSIARTVIRRATTTVSKGQRGAYPTIAILALTPGIDMAGLSRGLAHELGLHGRTRCVDRVDAEAAGEVDRLEEDFDHLILSAGPEANDWSKYCLSRADLILLAVKVRGQTEPGELERGILANVNRDLVGRLDILFVHPEKWVVHCAAAQWLGRLAPAEHHHVRSDNEGDLARLARIIAGRANNLTLSGGGARAFAQIGALRALSEFRIPIDRISGTSMGAAVAAIHALGGGINDAVRQMRELFLKRQPGKDYTLPVLSLLTGKRMNSIGLELFGDRRIEDLPIRYLCVSSDLGEGKVVEHFDGPIAIALRATAAMPVIAPPLLMGGRVLVDGGVLNNLPLDVMQDHFSGTFLAIDVSKHQPLHADRRWDLTCPSGFEILRDRLNPFGEKDRLPSIVDMLLRTATLASERQARRARGKADLLIAPPVETFAVMDFDCFDAIVEMGYRYTATVLEEVEKSPNAMEAIRGPRFEKERAAAP